VPRGPESEANKGYQLVKSAPPPSGETYDRGSPRCPVGLFGMVAPDPELNPLLARPWAIARSPVGKKLITGITGLGLALFVLIHMVGNLLMFVGDDAYNAYGRLIESLGPLLWLIELGLLGFVLVHAGYGIYLSVQNRRSRPVPYTTYTSRGYPSLQSLSSRTMVWTGAVLGIFIVTPPAHV
jgi:succinate dehydrogenase/fumarate reductase cytochrome b subunit